MGEPILTNDDMKRIREGFNQSHLPEELFGKVVDKIKGFVESGIMKLDEAVKKVLGTGHEPLAKDIKRDLYNWQYEHEANQEPFTGAVDVAKATGKDIDGESFVTTPVDKMEQIRGWENSGKEANNEYVPYKEVEYNPSKHQPPDPAYRKTVTALQIFLQKAGYLGGNVDYGEFDDNTWNAYVAFAQKNSATFMPNGKISRIITPDTLFKMAVFTKE